MCVMGGERKSGEPVVVFVPGTVRSGDVLQRRGSGNAEVFVEYHLKGMGRAWLPQGICYDRSDVHRLIQDLRREASYLDQQAAKYENWLERESMKGQ